MAIRDEEIRLKFLHIETDLPDAVGPVDNAQDAFFATDGHEPLKRKADAGVTHDGIEDRGANGEAVVPSPAHHVQEATFQLIFGDGIVEGYLAGLQRAVFLERDDALLHGAVHGLEIDDRLAGLEIQIVEHGGHAGRGILDKDAFILGGVDDPGHLLARLAEKPRVLLPYIRIWTSVGQV